MGPLVDLYASMLKSNPFGQMPHGKPWDGATDHDCLMSGAFRNEITTVIRPSGLATHGWRVMMRSVA